MDEKNEIKKQEEQTEQLTDASSQVQGDDLDRTALSGKFLTFKLGTECYALGIKYVEDIISILEITPVPQTSDFVKGLINLRGKVIPVIDLRLMFEMSQEKYHKETCIIIVKGSRGLIGVIVDVVSEVIDVSEAEIESAPDFGRNIDTDFILGMAKRNGDVKALIDIEKILGNGTMVEE